MKSESENGVSSIFGGLVCPRVGPCRSFDDDNDDDNDDDDDDNIDI